MKKTTQNNCLSDEELLAKCIEARNGYPPNHQQQAAIQEQIEGIKKRIETKNNQRKD